MIAAGSTQEDVSNIAKAVQSVGSQKGIDPRVVLAMILQESSGNVGAPTTTNLDGLATGGILQAQGCEGHPGQSGLTEVRVAVLEAFCSSLGFPLFLLYWPSSRNERRAVTLQHE